MKTTAYHAFIALLIACLLLPFAVSAAESGVNEAEFAAYKELAQVKLEATKTELQKDREKIEARLDSQDKRIGDLNTTLTEFGILITVLVFLGGLIGFFSVRGKAKEEARDVAQKEARDVAQKEAKEAAEQWLNAKGLEAKVSEFESKLADSHKTILEMTEQIKNYVVEADAHLLNIENHSTKVMALTDQIEREMSKISPESAPTQNADSLELEQAANVVSSKPNSEYTFKDWTMKAFFAWKQKDYEAVVSNWKAAAKVENILPAQKARALCNLGFALSRLKRDIEAIKAFDEVIEHFGSSTGTALRLHVGRALYGKGFALSELNNTDDGIMMYDVVINDYGNEPSNVLKDIVGMAHNNKAFLLYHRAKENWANEDSRSADLSLALEELKLAEQKITKERSPIVKLKQAYVTFLLDQKSEQSRILLLESLSKGQSNMYNDMLSALEKNTVPPDAEFRSLLDEVWAEVQAKDR